VIQQKAVGTATIPRIQQYSTVTFGGLTWFVKTAPLPVYPGNQFFVQPNVYVDDSGQLHLQLNQCGDSWCAAEVFTTQAVGYGTYTFTINSQLHNLDPTVTLGLFPWDAQAGDQNNREWDVEFGRWGNANATANAQYVVQPYNGPYNIYKFLMSLASASTHSGVAPRVRPVQVDSDFRVDYPVELSLPPVSVPTPGDVHLHMNLYLGPGRAPRE
jgi:hypothetical protein